MDQETESHKFIVASAIIFGTLFTLILLFSGFIQSLFSSVSTESDKFIPCDMDGDGICATADFNMAVESLGECISDENYHRIVDVDQDGCIGEDDLKILFSSSSSGYLKPETEQLFFEVIKRMDNQNKKPLL